MPIAAVRRSAFNYFQAVQSMPWRVRRPRCLPKSAADIDQTRHSGRTRSRSRRGSAEASGELYLATGDLKHLLAASEKAERAGGWRPSLEWALRALVIAPLNPLPVRRLFAVLESSAQPDILEEVATIFQSRNLHLQTAQLFMACSALMRGDARLSLSRLKALDDARVASNPVLAPYLGAIRALRAQSEEKLGDFRKAYQSYVMLNDAERAPDVDPSFVYKGAAHSRQTGYSAASR